MDKVHTLIDLARPSRGVHRTGLLSACRIWVAIRNTGVEITTMADDRIALHELLEARTRRFFREMIGFAANRLMELEIKVCGAGYGERTERRRDWETRAGSVELPIPKLWRDNQFPGASSRAGPQKRRLTVVIGSQRSWEWQYLWFGATYVKVRRDHRIGSIATIVAVGTYTDGRREALGMTAGTAATMGTASDLQVCVSEVLAN